MTCYTTFNASFNRALAWVGAHMPPGYEMRLCSTHGEAWLDIIAPDGGHLDPAVDNDPFFDAVWTARAHAGLSEPDWMGYKREVVRCDS